MVMINILFKYYIFIIDMVLKLVFSEVRFFGRMFVKSLCISMMCNDIV